MKRIVLLILVLFLFSACVHTEKQEENTTDDIVTHENITEDTTLSLAEETTSAKTAETTEARTEEQTSLQETAVKDVNINEIKALFFETEKAYSYFTGYADNVYAEGTAEINGQRYDRCSLANSLDGLRELVSPYISAENTEKLIKTSVMDGVPLFAESDNTLWRFGGFAAQWGLDAAVTEIVSATPQTDGSIKVDVNITMPEFDIETKAVYTCRQSADGNLMFTDDFELPIILVMKDADI